MKIPVLESILGANDRIAEENSAVLKKAGVFAVNLMASPGAGKTSLIISTRDALPEGTRIGAIEGDLASRIDADKLAALDVPVVQINTGGNCHLDAPMVRAALPDLPLADIDLLFIENVGNLVCPANFALGSELNVVVASVAEGHDKPYKYPAMFAAAGVVVLNKDDLAEVFEFDHEYFSRGVRMVNPSAPIFTVSCKKRTGITEWAAWLEGARRTFAQPGR